ncbi:polysaccharide biosynthesis/export family protein [Alienimonas californiensis]|uniref:Polysaccharide biosynthesis/export protein n=1 Tax=Alienimonas californiensis TaxID=2527989 RepID=A0A517PEF6_9PLAN|nr:polysaccharide biosynthesis/export family protein [Alienimonas californiensis]QDT17764.1 Polysaccharide biosynthesis/export protein [Alienimonas californiensis]
MTARSALRTGRGPARLAFAGAWAAVLTVALAAITGCQAMHPLDGVPAERLADSFRTPVRTPRRPIDPSLLGQPRPSVYRLDTGDVLGVFAPALYGDGGLGSPPVVVAETTLNLIPGQGFPHQVGRDGAVHLPFLGPVLVRGLTLEEARGRIVDLIRTQFEIDRSKEDPIVLLSVLKERTISVVVFRNETGPDGAVDNNVAGQGGERFDSPTGEVVELPAYQNDVLHALAATGGTPSLEGDVCVTVARAGGLRLTGCGPGGCQPAGNFGGAADEMAFGPIGGHSVGPALAPTLAGAPTVDGPQVVKIPMQLLPGQPPGFCHSDVILKDGDAVYVDSRTKDVFYTGGLLGPGSFRLPRDEDIDVLEALAVVQGQRQSVGTTRALTGNSVLSRDVTAGASSLIILRERPDGTRLRIEVDLRDAVVDPRQRILIRPQDYLILQYRKGEAFVAGFERFFIEGIVQGVSTGIFFNN